MSLIRTRFWQIQFHHSQSGLLGQRSSSVNNIHHLDSDGTFLGWQKNVFSKVWLNSTNSFNMIFVGIFDVDHNIAFILNDKTIMLFSQDFIHIALRSGLRIKEAKKDYLVFKLVILSYESCFPFVIFLNLHLMICILEI